MSQRWRSNIIGMESEMLARFKSFSLSTKETLGVELVEEDISIGMEEAWRSLIGKVFGEKRANFVGLRSAMMKFWHNGGLCKVVALDQNVFQFVFKEASNREGLLQGRLGYSIISC